MFKSYVTVALRNFWKDRNYALVNLVGLAIGFACVLMIVAYVRYELSYDTTYSNAPDVYRLVTTFTNGGVHNASVMTPEGLSKALADEYPDIKSFTSFWLRGEDVISKDGKITSLSCIYSDSNFFKVFNLPFKYGNAASLKTENGIVLSESAAEKFFPGKNPIGFTLTTDTKGSTQVIAGVFKDFPPNIHFGFFDAIVPRPISNEIFDITHGFSEVPQYVLLRSHSGSSYLKQKLNSFYQKYHLDNLEVDFQPVQAIHLHSNVPDDNITNSDIKYVYIFSAIAFLILFIACINYMNLTTARSLQRTREVGVRKVMGARRVQLSLQFLTESFLFFGITLPVAVLLAKLCWPSFASLLQLPTAAINLLDWQTVLILLLISVVSGILSGLYPAAFLSRLQPVKVLKGWKSPVGLGLRKSLIVFQFVISIALTIATIVVQLQLRHISRLNLGFNKEHLLVLYPPRLEEGQKAAFKQQLLSYRDVVSVSVAGGLNIGNGYGGSAGMNSKTDSTKEWKFAFIDADLDFIRTMQIPILQGRNFSADHAFDIMSPTEVEDSIRKTRKLLPNESESIKSSRSLIITRKTAEMIGLKKPYTGQVIALGALHGTVIGVVDDFKGVSLKDKNPAVVIRAYPNVNGNTFIRINPSNIQQTLAYIEKVWKQFVPGRSFQFSFVDEQVQKLYDSEQRLAKFFGIFAALAISIACLGLFSLVALIVQQRTKEIGIRKVLGAGVKNIVQLLSADFIKLVVISILIASPIAWWAMNKWLEDYESRISIDWWIFIVAGVIAIVIALATVSFQAIRAAMMNPVKSLRTE